MKRLSAGFALSIVAVAALAGCMGGGAAVDEQRMLCIQEADAAFQALDKAAAEKKLAANDAGPGVKESAKAFFENANFASAMSQEDHPDIKPLAETIEQHSLALESDVLTLDEVPGHVEALKAAWEGIKKIMAGTPAVPSDGTGPGENKDPAAGTEKPKEPVGETPPATPSEGPAKGPAPEPPKDEPPIEAPPGPEAPGPEAPPEAPPEPPPVP